ncbi:MAG TPA: hypothetical protein VLR88_07110 [Propionibacteriaceae bacterium]|nr:hypothetical protein [Propionibacteriaceae bacterium]
MENTPDTQLTSAIAAARAALDRAEAERPTPETVMALKEATELVASALNEAMAGVVLDGASVRQVAAFAGLAPNTVPGRLGSSALLADYVEDGKVSGEAIVRARYDQSRQPLRFSHRRSTT